MSLSHHSFTIRVLHTMTMLDEADNWGGGDRPQLLRAICVDAGRCIQDF